MKFTITVRCSSGHTEVLTRDLPDHESAEVMARVLRTGKCAICETPFTVTIRDPIEFN